MLVRIKCEWSRILKEFNSNILSKLWRLSFIIVAPSSPVFPTLIHILPRAEGDAFLSLRKFSCGFIPADLNTFSLKSWWDFQFIFVLFLNLAEAMYSHFQVKHILFATMLMNWSQCPQGLKWTLYVQSAVPKLKRKPPDCILRSVMYTTVLPRK